MTTNKYSNESRVVNQQLFDLIESVMETAVPMPLAIELRDLQVDLHQNYLTAAGREVMSEFDRLIADEQMAVGYACFVAGMRYSRALESLVSSFPFPQSVESDLSELTKTLGKSKN